MFDTQVYWIHLEKHTDILTEGYVGVSNDPELRFWDHKNDAKKNKHINPHLCRALQKHNEEIIQTILFVGEKSACYSLEEELRPSKGIGWNINKGGVCPPSRKGVKQSLKHKQAISKAKTGKQRSKFTEEHIKNISKSKKGKITSNAIKVKTPLGFFESAAQAAKAHDVSYKTIIRWADSTSPTKSEFKFIKNKITIRKATQ